jgi:NAD(P)-dependent dehydrogenase (short-subunit alcohol dehydrogenase family)
MPASRTEKKSSKKEQEKTVIVTGVTGAVGGATALEIAKSGAKTALLARDKQKLDLIKKNIIEKSGNKNIEIIVADFSDISSVKKAVKEFKKNNESLSALINIAAVFKKNRELSKDGLEMMFAVNHMAPFILTNSLMELLKKSPSGRIITVTAPSTTNLNFDDLQGSKSFFGLKSFGASKMANLLFTYALANRLKGGNVAASAFFPGLVKSDLMKELPPVMNMLFKIVANPPKRAAGALYKIAIDPEYQNINGKFIKYNSKEIKSSPYSYDKDVQEKLWKISEKFL